MKDSLTRLEDAFLRQALDKISELVTESDRLKEQANAAWHAASQVVVEHRGLTLSASTRIVVEKEGDQVTLYLQQPDPEPAPVQAEPALVE